MSVKDYNGGVCPTCGKCPTCGAAPQQPKTQEIGPIWRMPWPHEGAWWGIIPPPCPTDGSDWTVTISSNDTKDAICR